MSKMKWTRLEAGEYELRDSGTLLATIYREGPDWRWVLEEAVPPHPSQIRGTRTGLTGTLVVAMTLAEGAVNARLGLVR